MGCGHLVLLDIGPFPFSKSLAQALSLQSKHKIWIAFDEKTKMPNENYI
jgi:hypothetical protein